MKMNINTTQLLYTATENVRISDLNYGNHLGHTQLADLLHNIRALYLKNYGLTELNCYGAGMILLNITLECYSQCYFNDKLELNLYLNSVKGAKIEFSYVVKNLSNNKIVAHAITTMGFLDKEKMTPIKPPKELTNLMMQEKLLNC